MEEVEIPVSSLLLDTRNPRHRATKGQNEAIAALLGGHPEKIHNLAVSISEEGLNPLDRILVVRSDAGYVVLEGNRRIAAIKLTDNPALCQDPQWKRKFESVPSGRVSKINCVAVQSREEAEDWLTLRHGGELDGRGIVRWSSGMRIRRQAKAGTSEYRALAVINWLFEQTENGSNPQLYNRIEQVVDEKITTFARLIVDPDIRSYCKFSIDGTEIVTHDRAELVLVRLKKIVDDLIGGLTVTQVKQKEQRLAYIERIRNELGEDSDNAEESDGSLTGESERRVRPKDGGGAEGDNKYGDKSVSPDDVGARNDPAPEQPPQEQEYGGGHSGGQNTEEEPDAPPEKPQQNGKKRSKRNQPARPTKLFHGLRLKNASRRTKDVLREAQRLELESFKNSAAALTRMVVELVVVEAIETNGWKSKERQELKERIRTCLANIDPENNEVKLKDIRNQIDTRNSLISANTMNAFLHNYHYFPTVAELVAISDKYVHFLSMLDEEMGDGR